ncbi:MAG: hypothetical protein HQ567_29330, partial [Candidatus Nealsonbacteria bacterium]|nr:hypothetical protein [Candidatus Nealsonbacteria bacterium]
KMKGLNEKYILKRATRHLVPPAVLGRTKQPYRSPDAASFFDSDSQSARADYVEDLLSEERIRDDGVFHPKAVRSLVEKARRGKAIGTKDNMALVGVLSTQLLIEQFVRNSPASSCDVAFPADSSVQTPGRS